jgi:hypothetical protein
MDLPVLPENIARQSRTQLRHHSHPPKSPHAPRIARGGHPAQAIWYSLWVQPCIAARPRPPLRDASIARVADGAPGIPIRPLRNREGGWTNPSRRPGPPATASRMPLSTQTGYFRLQSISRQQKSAGSACPTTTRPSGYARHRSHKPYSGPVEHGSASVTPRRIEVMVWHFRDASPRPAPAPFSHSWQPA